MSNDCNVFGIGYVDKKRYDGGEMLGCYVNSKYNNNWCKKF